MNQIIPKLSLIICLILLSGCASSQPLNMECGTIEMPPLPALPVSSLNIDSSNSDVVKSYVATVQLLLDDRNHIRTLLAQS